MVVDTEATLGKGTPRLGDDLNRRNASCRVSIK